MADDSADLNLDETTDASSSGRRRGRIGGFFTGMLKWILIAIAAIILIVVVVFITVRIVTKNTSTANAIPIGEEYRAQREELDWYQGLDAIRTKTIDDIPSSVVARVFLGYKKDDKATSQEISNRRVELTAFLRRYFAQKSSMELRPQDEPRIIIELRNAINDEILSNSKIRDVSIQQLDVIEQ